MRITFSQTKMSKYIESSISFSLQNLIFVCLFFFKDNNDFRTYLMISSKNCLKNGLFQKKLLKYKAIAIHSNRISSVLNLMEFCSLVHEISKDFPDKMCEGRILKMAKKEEFNRDGSMNANNEWRHGMKSGEHLHYLK